MDWFRSWHGAPTDNKWLVIARRAGVQPVIVSAVFWALLDYASQQEDRGSVVGFDVETYALWAGVDEADILAVLDAMRAKGVISDGDTLAAWDKRQPKREDDSAERVRKHRQRKRDEPSESVTEDSVTQCNADVTQGNAPDKIRLDTEQRREEQSPADAVPVAPKTFADECADVQAKLKEDGANRPAILRGWYVRCFGEGGAPDYAYIGKVAKQVGGAGHLAALFMQLASRPPNGDVLAYIIATHKSKSNGKNGNSSFDDDDLPTYMKMAAL